MVARSQVPAMAGEGAAPHEPRSISPWTAFATLTLRMSRAQVPRFASHMSLEECLTDRAKRQEALAKGRFVVEIDHGGAERWTSDVRDALRRLEVEGSFVMSNGTTVAV